METLMSSSCQLWHQVGPWGILLRDPYTTHVMSMDDMEWDYNFYQEWKKKDCVKT